MADEKAGQVLFSATDSSAKWRATKIERPSGRMPLAFSGLILAFSVMGIVAWLGSPRYPELLWLSAAGISLAMLLWTIGRIERALFLLPGRDVTNADVVPNR